MGDFSFVEKNGEDLSFAVGFELSQGGVGDFSGDADVRKEIGSVS